MKETAYFLLDLTLFGEGSGDGGAGGEAAAQAGGAGAPAEAPKGRAARNPLANVQYGKAPAEEIPAQEPETAVTSDALEARKAEFERMIKGDYKDLFDERMQKAINARFKETKALESKVANADKVAPLLEMLASKYGVDAGNPEAVLKAVQEDDSYYEQEAMEKGLSVDQLKRMKALERENAQFKRAADEAQRHQNAELLYQKWQEESDACKQVYPNFDLRAEINQPETSERFMSLLKSGVDVRTAYEVVHKDDIIGGAMQLTAQKIQEKTIADIRTRGMRPAENGGAGNSTAVIRKGDPTQFTKRDRDEISRRVMRGERIEL